MPWRIIRIPIIIARINFIATVLCSVASLMSACVSLSSSPCVRVTRGACVVLHARAHKVGTCLRLRTAVDRTAKCLCYFFLCVRFPTPTSRYIINANVLGSKHTQKQTQTRTHTHKRAHIRDRKLEQYLRACGTVLRI